MTDTVNQDEINASRDLQEDTPQNRLRDAAELEVVRFAA